MRFFSPHTHTTFSYGDGFGTPAQHAARLARLGATGAALTDHGNVTGHALWEKALLAEGLHPVFGCELYTAPPGEQRKWHLTVMAENQVGYRNLTKLVTRSWAEGFYRWPTVHGAWLEEHSEGLIVLSGCSDSLLACTLLGGKSYGDKRQGFSGGDRARAEQVVAWFKAVFGDRYYLEVQRFPELERTRTLNHAYARLSRRMGVPLAATADIHYPHPEDNEMQKILHSALRGGGKTVEQTEQEWEYDISLSYPLSDKQIGRQLVQTGLTRHEAWDAILATEDIGQRCQVVLPKAKRIKFPTEDAEALIWEWLREGWRYRWPLNKHLRKDQAAYSARLKYEMNIIVSKGYVDYFLMIADAVRWAKDHGIAVGPARGSAAASLVCYKLRITEVDPLQFPTMMFERFLDVSRDDLPDIDLDFPGDRIHEVRSYLASRWGEDNVGNLGNFVRYRGKNSIQDIARVYSIPKWAEEGVKGLILERSGGDARQSDSLEDTFEFFPKAKELVEQFPRLRLATKLEGNYRGMGVHAAGLVVSSEPITDVTALYTREIKGHQISVVAADKKSAEYLGMLKVDFLGLTTMKMISLALGYIGMTLDELYTIPLDDPKTLAAFKRTDVTGIFQFEGRAQRIVTKDVSPDNFMHLADINALARPGPLFSGVAAEYVARKHGRSPVEPLHPIVDKLTQHTYGTIVYQEQVLTIIREMGGFPVAKVGDIRRIISQKLGEASMNNMRQQFQDGARQLHGVKDALSLRIWRYMVTSANYSFNIAHCISYSMLGFWCMWLKVHHPLAFYAAQLACTPPDKKNDKRPRLMQDAMKHGIQIAPPDAELSRVTWAPEGVDVVRAGLTQVPGIAEKTAEHMLLTRDSTDTLLAPWKWADYGEVRGIGPKKIAGMEAFASDPDPFGLQRTRTTLENYRSGIRRRLRAYRGLPSPTHTSEDVPDGALDYLVWMGFCTSKNYKNAVEAERTRSGKSEEEILANLKDPHLLDSCVLRCFDDGPEDVYLRVDRWRFPALADACEAIEPGVDIVIAIGKKRENDFGVSIIVNNLIVITPTDKERGVDFVDDEEEALDSA